MRRQQSCFDSDCYEVVCTISTNRDEMQRRPSFSPPPSKNPLIVGITGTTNAGKTTLTRKLLQRFPGSRAIHQDDFFRAIDDPEHEHVGNLNHHNWDCLSATNVEKLIETFYKYGDELISEDPRNAQVHPSGSTNGHSAREGAPSVTLLIIEGILVLNIPEIVEACDLKYFLHLTERECIARRLLRNYDPPDVPGYFEQIVWPMHLYYSAMLSKRHKDICYINGMDDVERTFQKVLNDIATISTGSSPVPVACCTVGIPPQFSKTGS